MYANSPVPTHLTTFTLDERMNFPCFHSVSSRTSVRKFRSHVRIRSLALNFTLNPDWKFNSQSERIFSCTLYPSSPFTTGKQAASSERVPIYWPESEVKSQQNEAPYSLEHLPPLRGAALNAGLKEEG